MYVTNTLEIVHYSILTWQKFKIDVLSEKW